MLRHLQQRRSFSIPSLLASVAICLWPAFLPTQCCCESVSILTESQQAACPKRSCCGQPVATAGVATNASDSLTKQQLVRKHALKKHAANVGPCNCELRCCAVEPPQATVNTESLRAIALELNPAPVWPVDPFAFVVSNAPIDQWVSHDHQGIGAISRCALLCRWLI